MAKEEVTTNEIMEFLEENMVTRTEFNDFRKEFYVLKEEAVTQTHFKVLKDDVKELSGRVDHIENQMVTKDYLDDKFAVFGAEIGLRINKQTERHEILVDVLVDKSILQKEDIQKANK